MPVRS